MDDAPVLSPLIPPEDWIPGKYASFPVSDQPMFGPDELGEYKSAIDDMDATATKSDSAARNWEILQAWEAQLFLRGYQYLNANRQGFSMYGGVNGSRASGAEIIQTQNAGKMFACNVYAAREDKISSILAVDVPGLTFVPKTDSDPVDQTMADASKKYLKVWLNDAGIKDVVGKIATLFYTDATAMLWTGSWADEQAWGTEQPQQAAVLDETAPEGVTPETQKAPAATDVPAVRELTLVFGKLDRKVPIAADDVRDMSWQRISRPQNVYILKERYPWIEDKISSGAKTTGELDTIARMNVRLGVQSSSSSGDSLQQDATETFTWYRPSQYRCIEDKAVRKIFRDQFPSGMLVVHAGGQFALCRNEGMDDHLAIVHCRKGSGQNRRSIGANYLPLQKVLNGEISLTDRWFRASIARRFHDSEAIDSEAMNGQINDPAKSTPLMLKSGQSISDVTGIEAVSQPNTSMLDFVQWLIQGAPEVMDGGEPSMFGAQVGGNDQGVYQTAKLKRDAARGIYTVPWAQICIGIAKAAQQAAVCAGQNRVTNIRSNVPGQGKLEIEIANLRGEALCYPESLDLPQSIAEQEQAAIEAVNDKPAFVQLLNGMVSDPRNLPVFSKFPSFEGWEMPGLDAVKQQQGEFELLLKSGPLPNPQLSKAQELLAQSEAEPQAQTPEGQQAVQQLQQAVQQLPPQVSSVTVAQDGSENHAIHAQIVLGFLTSPEGRSLKNGSSEPGPNGEPSQQDVWQNLKLHWQEHVDMSQKLTPPQEVDFKGTVSVDPSKFAPDTQSKIFEAMGLQVAPQELANNELVPHEVITEKEGVDEAGVPIKQKIAMINPAGKLR